VRRPLKFTKQNKEAAGQSELSGRSLSSPPAATICCEKDGLILVLVVETQDIRQRPIHLRSFLKRASCSRRATRGTPPVECSATISSNSSP
jgi:hypothetical protein